jgi:hypothetical protein
MSNIAKRKQVKINFWRLLSKAGRIKDLVETIIDLVAYLRNASKDPILKALVDKLDEQMDDILGR